VLDLGPKGGNKGGRVVAEGMPEQVAEEPRSHTGHYLKPLLQVARAEAALTKKKTRASTSMRAQGAAE
jgi:excinuclease ABC subunit A